MPLVQVKEIYKRARAEGYGVSGFCAENMEMVHAILLAVEETRSPVIVALWEKDIEYAGEGCLEAIIRNYAEKTDIPVGIMLDHGTSLRSCLRCVEAGHTCVMIDASHESYGNNVQRTREVCRAVHPKGVLVEGEIGTIRRSFEDNGPYSQAAELTDPESVDDFVKKSEADAVAVSVGTESGFADQKIDFARLERISKKTDAYLIIHGGSGTPGDDIKRAVQCGATAFRFASENRIVYLDALENARKIMPLNYPDTRLIYGHAVQAVKEQIMRRMAALGCAGKAE
jgi:fructose-bisphosphate aldolase, class II